LFVAPNSTGPAGAAPGPAAPGGGLPPPRPPPDGAGRPARPAAASMRACTAASRAGKNCGAVNILGRGVLIYTAAACANRPTADPARRLKEIPMAVDIAQLLAFAVKNKASDLHLSSGVPPMIRVDGDMKRINMPPLTHKEVHSMVYDIMNDKQRKAYEEFYETDFSFEIPKLARFRVNAFNQNRGAAAVFRSIPSLVLSLDDLNAPKIFKDISMQPRGLVLVTGPTGSGKSTTLAAMINYVNDNRPDHIITIEDPIEFVHESKRCLINQREVHRDTLGFSEALRSALREDPDVILVGEMRDLETIRLALTGAETGHLVFGTLHTSSAAKTIDRIVDVFPAAEKEMVRAMLSESLRAVISQTLLKRIGGGRIAAHEIMIGTPAIRNLIREGKIAQMYSAIQTGQAAGMQTLDQCLKELLQKGLITKEEARFRAQNKEDF
jgi:twitching motility protein PilT